MKIFGAVIGKLRSRRGVGLVEVVISIAVIVIVSIAATSIITSSFGVTSRAKCENEGRIKIENAIEAFKATGGEDQFEEALGCAENKQDADEDGKIVYVFDFENDYSVVIKVNFGGGRPTFSGVMNDPDGEPFIEVDYTKAKANAGGDGE